MPLLIAGWFCSMQVILLNLCSMQGYSFVVLYYSSFIFNFPDQTS